MTLDQVDAAFVRRLSARPRAGGRGPDRACISPAPRPRPADPPQPPAPQATVPTEQPAPVEPAADAPPAPLDHGLAQDDTTPVMARLLEQAPQEWAALAGHVEAARQRGRRVIAIAGGRSGEGRTTLVRCLAATLRSRGRDVVCAGPHDLAAVASGPDGRGPTHDKRIILVDAGIWFPPGPIRRPLLQVVSLGCEAAILVRRAGAPGGLARQAALEALGIEVLGEVLTFSPPETNDIRAGDQAA